jgi:hypothetical protein
MQSTQNQITLEVTPAQTLRDAALYLRRYGWIQGCYFDQSATVFTPAADVVAAIGFACYGGPCEQPELNYLDPGFGDFNYALLVLSDYLQRCYGTNDPYAFNDAKGRRAGEVTKVLEEAADHWDLRIQRIRDDANLAGAL